MSLMESNPVYVVTVVVLRYKLVVPSIAPPTLLSEVVDSKAHMEPEESVLGYYYIYLLLGLLLWLVVCEYVFDNKGFFVFVNRIVESLCEDEKDCEDRVVEGLKLGKRIEDGVNGVYFVECKEDVIAIFKPIDEEQHYATHGNKISPSKRGITVGDACLKERAAFVLGGEFCGVPETEIVSINGRMGSMQMYVPNIGCAEDYSSSLYLQADVQRIALFDLRMLNVDRHMGNILVTKEGRLVPIDHGFMLPDYRCLSDAWFEWYSWKQASLPLVPELEEYINSVDIMREAQQLLQLGIRPECVLTHILCSLFVKFAVSKGYTLREMAEMMQRNSNQMDSPSELEIIVNRALLQNPEFEINARNIFISKEFGGLIRSFETSMMEHFE